MTRALPCADLVRTFDWSSTALGPYAQWPERLKGYVAMVLAMPRPAIIFWGPTQIQIYNDGYGIIMGPRHPRYFGATYQECWPDTYPVIYPWMQRVLAGEVIEVERSLFVLTRYGFTEEAYFTFTFSPLLDDDDRIQGILQPVVEVTREVIADRRAQALRELEQAASGARSVHDAVAALDAHPKDIPFALLYRVDADGQLRLAETCGLTPAMAARASEPASVVARAFVSREVVAVAAGAVLAGEPHVGTWDEPTRDAFVLPVTRASGEESRGVLVCGLSPRLAFDDAYRNFVHAITRELATLIDVERARAAGHELEQLAARARAQAEAERRRLHAVFENAPVAITIVTGARYVVELANPRALAMWERSLADVHGKPVFEALPELEGQGLRELLDEVRATGKPFIGTEVRTRLRGADGQLREAFFNFVYEPMKDASGAVEAVLGVAIDVTVFVSARQAAETLATELQSARHDAEQARDQAEQANRAKDEFLAMLGHELRNPLAPIFTALELWRDRDPSGASAKPREAIERQARHLKVLVDDLLDVSRITSGKVDLLRTRVALAEVIAKALETASPLFEKRQQQLQVDSIPTLLVDGDPARLVQVFANLFTNAAKYTQPGGRIWVAVRRDGDEVVTTVRDTGRGISPAMLPVIFDMFVQERQTIDRSHGGLGIGLAIVKNLVALHGGRVEAHSDGLGHGSTFVVRLPLASPEPHVESRHAGATAAPPPGVAAGEGRVLIIDDNEDAATLLADVLASVGYVCRIAHDGRRGLEIARAEEFDTIVVDIGLPVMDGYEVARHLRSSPQGAALQLIAVTGYGQESDKERAHAAGFDAHLVKPISVRQLSQILLQRR